MNLVVQVSMRNHIEKENLEEEGPIQEVEVEEDVEGLSLDVTSVTSWMSWQ